MIGSEERVVGFFTAEETVDLAAGTAVSTKPTTILAFLYKRLKPNFSTNKFTVGVMRYMGTFMHTYI